MNILSITATGVLISVLSLTVKNMKSETGQLISVAGTIVIISAIIPYIITVVQTMYDFAALSPSGENFLTPILKITGISYITQTGSERCLDMGENSLSARVLTAGKIAITIITLPIAKECFEKIMGILA